MMVLPASGSCAIAVNSYAMAACFALAVLGIFIGVLGFKFFAWGSPRPHCTLELPSAGLASYGALVTGIVVYVMVGGMTSASTTGAGRAVTAPPPMCAVAAAVSASVGLVGGGIIWLAWYLLNLYALPLILIGGVRAHSCATCTDAAADLRVPDGLPGNGHAAWCGGCVDARTERAAGNVYLWQNEFNYGMAMACLSLLLPFPLFFFVRPVWPACNCRTC